MYKKITDKYIRDAKSGKVLVCNWVKLAIDRHLKDLERDDIYFDEAAAVRFLTFSSYCKYTKGKLAKEGRYIEFSPQQVFKYWVLFGWMNLDGTRRYRKSYQEVARKNGKSEEAAVVSNFLFLKDGEFGAEVYTAATKLPQAKIVFNAARQMIIKLREDSASIRKQTIVGVSNISMLETNSKFEPLSNNSDKEDGLNPHAGIIDEYHAHVDSDLLEVIRTGMGSREQPMLFIITTAGFEKQYPCYSIERKLATEVLQGIKKDDSLFAIIFTLDEDDDWKDEKVWVKSNPNIGITPTWRYMREELNDAINKGVVKEVQFKTKNLNIWTDSSMACISDEEWQSCRGELPDLTGRRCYGGLDLAAKMDTNSFPLLFPPDKEGEPIYLKTNFWIPKNTIEKKNEIGNYKQWKMDGWVNECGEDIISYDKMTSDILNLHEIYDIESFTFDRWGAFNGLLQNLEKEGIEGLLFGQGFKDMSEPTKEFIALVKAGKIIHDGNPMMRWMIGNIELSIDPAENIKIDKKKSREKVDGPVSVVMAIGCWTALRNEKEDTSVYETRGIIDV